MNAKERQETLRRFCVPVQAPVQSDNAIAISSDEDDEGTGKKGKGKAKSSLVDTLKSRADNPKVMLISLKAGALGLNLTVANNVYL